MHAVRRIQRRIPRAYGGSIRAGDGNRTRVASLEGWSSTIELHPRAASRSADRPSLATTACDTRSHAGALPSGRRVHRGALRGEPALRRARDPGRARPRHDAHAHPRDRVQRDHVRHGGAGGRLRRADLHARAGAPVRRASDPGDGVRARLGGSRRRRASCRPAGLARSRSRSTSRPAAAGCTSSRPCSARPSKTGRSSHAARGLETEDLVDDLPIVPVSTGIPHLMVPVRDEASAPPGRAAGRRPAGSRARPPTTPSRSTCSRSAPTAT